MPEYLAPGVFVEETSFRQKTIEGVSTSTTGFVGPTRFGPTEGEPELLTSFADFERIYGGLDGLNYTDQRINYLAHGVRAYFEEGGKRLYVVRLFQPGSDSGVASWQSPDSPPSFELRARYPGAAGNLRVTLLFKREGNVRNVVGGSPGTPILSGVRDQQVVLAASGSPEVVSLYQVESVVEASGRRFRLRDAGGAVELDAVAAVYPLTVTVTVAGNGRFDQEQVWDELSFDPSHPRSLNTLFAAQPERRATALFVPLVFDPLGLSDGMAIATALLDLTNSEGDTLLSALADPGSSDTQRSFQTALSGGNDGGPPLPIHYQGQEIGGVKTGLVAFEDLEDISIVAAPGSTLDASDGDAVMRFLIGHCERMRYRVAVLDSVLGYLPGQMRDLRGGLDSTRAALYYPWVRVTNPLAADPLAPSEILLPPSGFMAGIYARNDVERGVHKAPANEVIRLALGFELLINKAQQEVLNPLGINCLRFFEGRGFRVWGARTISSDPEWKYLNVRRYFAFLERSIEKSTQFAVFEPNGPVLWENIRETVADFLFNEWASNHLLGTKPEQAYFVRCDRTTMTQNDIDNGRMICLIGVAPLRPAEFVIFRIGQKTADSRS